MSANPNTRVIDNAIESSGGLVWNRLHSEREDICEALLKDPVPGVGTGAAPEEDVRNANWHRELLQARLRKIDDGLDRLMSGSYGNCCKCGRWIEDTKLDFDPAVAFCSECWQREQRQTPTDPGDNSQTRLQAILDSLDHLVEMNPSQNGVELATLTPFDTIWVRTLNSDYRIFLLDPKTGRALVEGGRDLVEPVEAMVSGSTFGGSMLKIGWIGIGLRIEMWVHGRLVSTSTVQSFHVEHQTPVEPASAFVS